MNAPEFQPGEIVNVVIKGVRVTGDQGPRGTLTIADEHGTHYVLPPQAAIERVAPPEWPPQVGDLWAGDEGALAFARRSDNYPGVVMLDARDLDEDTGTCTPNQFLDMYGLGDEHPKLVYRDGGEDW